MPTALAEDVHKAVEVFMGSLNQLAKEHKRPQEYVRLLGGFGGFKQAKERPTTPFGAFCSKKMGEGNVDKEKGHRMTLQDFLDTYHDDKDLKVEYEKCDKDTLIDDFKAAKQAKASAPERVSNISVSKAVYAKVGNITASCHELNQLFGTQIALLYGRGNASHTYNPGSFVTEGAETWLQTAEIGHNCPNGAARQLDAFIVSGCAKRVDKTEEASATREYHNTRADCRKMIQDGLAVILRKKDVSRAKKQMNYIHYEDKIVEVLEVALDGWPIPGRVCNPGDLNSYDIEKLRKALTRRVCKWITLTPEEVSARRIDNQQCAANGEQVYGPPRKQWAQNVVSHSGGDSDDDDDADDE